MFLVVTIPSFEREKDAEHLLSVISKSDQGPVANFFPSAFSFSYSFASATSPLTYLKITLKKGMATTKGLKAIAPVPTATDFLDIILSKTQRKTPTVSYTC